MFGALIGSSWRRHAKLRWSLAVGLLLFQLLLGVAYEAFGATAIPNVLFEGSGLSKVMEAFSGSSVSMLSPAGWMGFGWVHPIALVMVVAWVTACGASALAGEVEDGTIELLASRPVDRRSILGARIIASFLGLGVVLAAGYAGTLASIAFFPDLAGFSPGAAGRLALGVVPMLVLVGGVAFLASAVSSVRRRVYAAATAFTVVSYFLNFGATLWDPLAPAAPASFFHYVSPAEWAQRGIQWGPAALLVGVGSILLAGSLVAVDRRDLAA